MNDMSQTIIAKSDQVNACDLIGAPRTITISEVRIKAGEDQPVSILIEGDKKSFRPCKGVRRLLVRVWGADASKYIGQSMTLFCDPGVTWAGKEEGGIRVSHMTGIGEPIVEYMRTSRAATKPYKILPLVAETRQPAPPETPGDSAAHKFTAITIAAIGRAPDLATLDKFVAGRLPKINELQTGFTDLYQSIDDALRLRREVLNPQQGRTDAQHGDQFPGDDDGMF